jgi:hypothetical protein
VPRREKSVLALNVNTKAVAPASPTEQLALTSTASTASNVCSATSTVCVRSPSPSWSAAADPRSPLAGRKGSRRSRESRNSVAGGVAALHSSLCKKALDEEREKLQRVKEWQAWECMIFW